MHVPDDDAADVRVGQCDVLVEEVEGEGTAGHKVLHLHSVTQCMQLVFI